MISINDVDCKCLINGDSKCVEQTGYVKENWNGMDEEKRSGYWTTEASNITLSARSVLCDLYEKIENSYCYNGDDDEFYEQLWANTPYNFVNRFQEMLDAICEWNESIVLKRREKIDPTIDLEEV